MKFGLGACRKRPNDTIKQFHSFANFHVPASAQEPADALDIKIALLVATVFATATLNLAMGLKCNHGFSNDDANLQERKNTYLMYTYGTHCGGR